MTANITPTAQQNFSPPQSQREIEDYVGKYGRLDILNWAGRGAIDPDTACAALTAIDVRRDNSWPRVLRRMLPF